MPKLIKNLQARILEVAERLFSEHGYNDVDMRAISSELGIAVGTLYNYFPDKRSLFIEVFNQSWRKIFLKLDQIIESDNSSHEKLFLFTDKVYEGLIERKGMGIDLLVDSLHEVPSCIAERDIEDGAKSLEGIGKALKEKAKILIEQIANDQSTELDEYTLDNLADALLLLVWGSVVRQCQCRKKHIDFICDMIESYIAKKVS